LRAANARPKGAESPFLGFAFRWALTRARAASPRPQISQREFTEKAWEAIVAAPEIARANQQQARLARSAARPAAAAALRPSPAPPAAQRPA
jgi:hypothetical protein